MGVYGNFLRGATTTSSTGIAEFTTIFPGMSQGANHVNVAVHTSSSMSSSTTHVGKLYFENHWNDLILGTSAYTQNSNPKVVNENDADFTSAAKKGYSPVIG
jgi:protocatechuate 3,4-dioxygenase beta subunit